MAEKKSRHRSPNYPAISLRAAVGKAETIYKADGTASTTRDGVLAHLGYDKPHSLALKMLSALKKFGLLSQTDERYKLSQRALDIVAREEGDSVRAEALRDAALSPAIYLDLIKEHAAAGRLPSDSSLSADLKAVKHFNANVVDGFISDLKDSLEFAGLSDLYVLNLGNGGDGEHPARHPLGESPPAAKPMKAPALAEKPKVFQPHRTTGAEEVLNQRVSRECVAHENGGAKLDHRAANRSCFWAE